MKVKIKNIDKAIEWLKSIKSTVQKLIDKICKEWANQYYEAVAAYIVGSPTQNRYYAANVNIDPFLLVGAQKRELSSGTIDLREKVGVRLSDWKNPQSVLPQNVPLYATGELISTLSVDANPGTNYAKVYLDPTVYYTPHTFGAAMKRPDADFMKKALFLHFGGFTSPASAIPNKWVPPRPFMTYPWVANRNFYISIMNLLVQKHIDSLKPS